MGKSMVDSVSIRFRANQVQAMHEVIRMANDEEIYMDWINLVPDEPTREDFTDIGEDEDFYNDIVDFFIELVSRKGYRA